MATDAATPAPVTTIAQTATDTMPRASLELLLAMLNDQAKALRRRGYIGTHGAEYVAVHGRIDQVLADWEQASA